MKILYKDNEGVKVITPANWLQRIDEVTDEEWEQILATITADKDVPSGLNYLLVTREQLEPYEQYPQEVLEIDINETNRSGVGLTLEQFNAKYPLLNWVTVNV